MLDNPREPHRRERVGEKPEGLDELLRDVPQDAGAVEPYRDPKPPTPRQRTATRALVLTAMLVSGGIGIGSVSNWAQLQWWDLPRADTAATPPCTDSVTAPTLTATPLTGDSTATLQGSAFASTCSGATHTSTDWVMWDDTGSSGGAVDTVWVRLANADSLTRWTGAGITSGTSDIDVGDTIVASMRYYSSIGSPSRIALDTFIVSSVQPLDWFCDWGNGTGTTSAAIRGTASTGAGLTQCYGGESGVAALLASVAKPSGFPAAMTNVLDVLLNRNTAGSRLVNYVTGPDSIPVGQYLFIRRLDLNAMALTTCANLHSPSVGTGGTGYVSWWFLSALCIASDSSYQHDFEIYPAQEVGPGGGRFRDFGCAPTVSDGCLRAFTVYERHERYHRFHADSVRVRIMILNANTRDTVATGADFQCMAAEDGGCNTASHPGCAGGGFRVDTVGKCPVAIVSASRLRDGEAGNNGSDPSDPNTTQHWYWGGMAARVSANANDWIGIYPVTPEPGP